MSELPGLCREALARPGGAGVLEFEHRWYGWDDLRRVAARLGDLVAQSGVAADAPVTFIPRNRPWAIAALLALLGDGRTLRMVYAFQSPAGIIRDIQRLAAPLVIAEPGEFAPEVTAAMAAAGYAGITVEGLDAAPLAGAEQARASALLPATYRRGGEKRSTPKERDGWRVRSSGGRRGPSAQGS